MPMPKEVDAIRFALEDLIDEESAAVSKYDNLMAKANRAGLRHVADTLFRIKEEERRHWDRLQRELKDLQKEKR